MTFPIESTCPGCNQKAVLDALSRFDDETVICGPCSAWEARWQARTRGSIPLSSPGHAGGETRFTSGDPLTDHQ